MFVNALLIQVMKAASKGKRKLQAVKYYSLNRGITVW